MAHIRPYQLPERGSSYTQQIRMMNNNDIQMEDDDTSSNKRSNSGAPNAKRLRNGQQAAKTGGGAGAHQGTMMDPQPIPLPMPLQQMTITFSTANWIEITNDLKYYHGSSLLANLFDPTQHACLSSLKNYFPLMQIGPLKMKLSNHVFLLDSATQEASTASMTTSITPQMYFLHITPEDTSADVYNLVSTSLNTGPTTAPILTYEEKNLVYDTNGPFITMSPVDPIENIEALSMVISNADIANGTLLKAGGTVGLAATRVSSPVWPTYRKVFDRKNYKIIKAGDVIEIDVKTELNNSWIPTKENYFQKIESGSTQQVYHFPCRNGILNKGSQRYDTTLMRENHDHMLHHHFFTCPPIKGTNNTILKQRVSTFMEITLPVTLHRRVDSDINTTDANAHTFNKATWAASQITTGGTNGYFYQ